MLRQGIRVTRRTSLRDFLDLAYQAIPEQVDTHRQYERIDQALAQMFPDRETWGADPAAVVAADAMMDAAGGPAPLRKKGASQRDSRDGNA